MLPSVSYSPAPPVEQAVLLVLLPPAASGIARPDSAGLASLQQRLGPAVRVLKIDEASHPTVVRSFATTELPASVLVWRGTELWRCQGLPDGNDVSDLLAKLSTRVSAA